MCDMNMYIYKAYVDTESYVYTRDKDLQMRHNVIHMNIYIYIYILYITCMDMHVINAFEKLGVYVYIYI